MVHRSRLGVKEGKRITGIAVLGRNVYVIGTMSNEIEVFELESSKRLRPIQSKMFKSPKDITTLKNPGDNLFIVDSIDRSCCVLVYRVSKNSCIKLLEDIHEPYTLSSTSTGQLMLLKEYKDWSWTLELHDPSKVRPIQSIRLPSEIKYPKHAVQTRNSSFVICYGTGELQEDRSWSVWTVGQVSREGKLLKKLPTFDAGPFYYLAYAADDAIFVSDGKHDQLIKLNSDLTEVKLLARDRVKSSYWKPWKLCSGTWNKQSALVVGHAAGYIDVFTWNWLNLRFFLRI